jgi:hypothetical protein
VDVAPAAFNSSTSAFRSFTCLRSASRSASLAPDGCCVGADDAGGDADALGDGDALAVGVDGLPLAADSSESSFDSSADILSDSADTRASVVDCAAFTLSAADADAESMILRVSSVDSDVLGYTFVSVVGFCIIDDTMPLPSIVISATTTNRSTVCVILPMRSP